MIVKILGSASSDFHGVQYNDKKVEKGKGELLLMKNFPSFINETSKAEDIRNYLKSMSNNGKVKNPQFHAVISGKFQENSKEELSKISEGFMQEMGYGDQPFITVFHNDTENNHVHIVSTRVDKHSRKKINDSFEKLKAQKALQDTMEKQFGIHMNKELDKLLHYKLSSIKQLETLLSRSGYKLSRNTNDEKFLTILKNGVTQQKLAGNQIVYDHTKNDMRAKQLKAIISKYKHIYSNKVFRVEDYRKQEATLPDDKRKSKEGLIPQIEFESELQKKLRDVFGIDLVFHHKDNGNPFGYTVIDHKSKAVYKGSEIMKMNELFEFTSEKIDKRLFESIKDFNIPNDEIKKMMLDFLQSKYPEYKMMDFMLFNNKRLKNREVFMAIKSDVKEYVKTQIRSDIGIVATENGKHYAIHSRLHYIGELKSIIGESQYQEFLNGDVQILKEKSDKTRNELKHAVNDLLFELMKKTSSSVDSGENELRKRRRKRNR